MLNKREESISRTESASTEHRGQMVGRADVGIKFRRNRRRKNGIVCRTMNATESPIVSGINEERKNQPARKEEQAGVLIDRVIGVLRERKA